MLPRGFFGTEADVLTDVIITALPVVLAAMTYAWLQARRGRWTVHRNVQSGLAAVLFVVVGALEINLHILGGVEGMVSPERGVSDLARTVLSIHLSFAGSTALVWLGLVGTSWLKFPRPPRPASFSRIHRVVGRLGLAGMVGTAVTGFWFYLALFVFE